MRIGSTAAVLLVFVFIACVLVTSAYGSHVSVGSCCLWVVGVCCVDVRVLVGGECSWALALGLASLGMCVCACVVWLWHVLLMLRLFDVLCMDVVLP